jgi:hypothetical protein
MTPLWWMVAASFASWLMVVMAFDTGAAREILLGMLAPLAGAAVTWVIVTWTYPARPERLTARMMKAFAGKVVFFGVYVTVMLGVLSLQPVPFAISFTSYFIALHVTEAFLLRRVFIRGAAPSAV